jgi:hypothetical protein
MTLADAIALLRIGSAFISDAAGPLRGSFFGRSESLALEGVLHVIGANRFRAGIVCCELLRLPN